MAELTRGKQFHRIGIVGRFKPLHRGHAKLLDELCSRSEEVIIGIGSSNRYNMHNPFTAQETEAMLRAYLVPRHDNFKIIYIPDFGQYAQYNDGTKWAENVKETYPSLDAFVSGNAYTAKLLSKYYTVIDSFDIVLPAGKVNVASTDVRIAMARQEGWERLVPKEVADYLQKNKLVERFRREFGVETLNLAKDDSPGSHSDRGGSFVGSAVGSTCPVAGYEEMLRKERQKVQGHS